MNYNDEPPSYEECVGQNKYVYVPKSSYQPSGIKGPDSVNWNEHFMFADFIPWSESLMSPDDISILLGRVNRWLLANCQFTVTKCEFIPRMISSRKRLDSVNCYVFYLTCGRTIFINQLRLHLTVNTSKSDPDHICMKTYIPGIVTHGSIDMSTLSRKYVPGIDEPIFEDLSVLISKVNTDINNGVISGEITNVSTFYYKIINDFYGKKDTIFYRDSEEPKFHLKSLRVFFKYGKPINGILRMKSFRTVNETSKLDELIENAMCFINNMTTQKFVSIETFPELQEDSKFALQKTIVNHNCSLVYGLRFVRFQTIRMFYLTNTDSIWKPLQFQGGLQKIFWIVPRKIKNTFENYNSFLDYAQYVIKLHGPDILDMETIIIPNALSWSAVRHQTIKTYYNEESTNYQLYVIRLILKADSVISIKDPPSPYHTLTTSSDCIIS